MALARVSKILCRLSSKGVGPASSNHLEPTVDPGMKLMTIYGAPITLAVVVSKA